MDRDGFHAAIERDSARLAEVARGNLDLPVPTCPEWRTDYLVAHTGAAHSWVKGMVAVLSQEVGSPESPPEGGDLVAWFESGATALVDTLKSRDPGDGVWTWHRPDRTVGFWDRRMAHETAVHRYDMEVAAGEATPMPTDLAVDGIDEYLTVVTQRWERKNPFEREGSIHIHTTDGDGEWTLVCGRGPVQVTTGHSKGDAAIRGSASDIYLGLWGRKDPEELEILGDLDLAHAYLGWVEL